MKKIFFIFLTYYLIGTAISYSAPKNIYEVGDLSCNLITSLCQDAKGFVWIGTEYGLNRFDGIQFHHFIHQGNDSTSLQSNMIKKLYVDKESVMWIGLSNGLQRYMPDSETFQTIPFENGYTPSVTDIIELADGEFWAATDGRGIFRFNKKTGIMESLKGINELCGGYVVKSIHEDRYGRKWFSVRERGIVCLNKNNKLILSFSKDELTGSNPGKIVEDNDGMIFVSVAGHILMFDETSESFVTISEKNGLKLDIREIIKLADGHVVVGTYRDGMYIVDKQQRVLSHYDVIGNHSGIHTAKIVAMLEDRNKNLWLGSFNHGVVLMRNHGSDFNFWKIPQKERDEGNIITSIYQYKDKNSNNFLVGIENNGLYEIGNDGRISAHYLPEQTIISAFEDSEGTFWVGTYYEGLARWDKHASTLNFLPQTKGKRIKSIVEDRNKNLYISMFGIGVAIYNITTGKITDITNAARNNGLRNKWVNQLYCDSKGRIWIGHYKGISCYHPRNKQFIETEMPDLLGSSITYAIFEDKEGNVWIGTNNGLFVATSDFKSFRQFSTENGLSNNVICGIAEDYNGNIWCSTYWKRRV